MVSSTIKTSIPIIAHYKKFLTAQETIDRNIYADYNEGDPSIVIDLLPENLPGEVVTILQSRYQANGWSDAVVDVEARTITLTL